MINTSILSGDANATAIGAIMLYDQERNGIPNMQIATVHKMETIAGVPTILPGRLFTEKDPGHHPQRIGQFACHTGYFMAGSEAFGQRSRQNGLVNATWQTTDVLQNIVARQKYVQRQHGLSGPGLVWMAIQGRGLNLYATSEDGRPTPATELYQAPFFTSGERTCVRWKREPASRG